MSINIKIDHEKVTDPNTFLANVPNSRRISSNGGGLGKSPYYPKYWLVLHLPPLLCFKNIDFSIFMQSLAILVKIFPHKLTPI